MRKSSLAALSHSTIRWAPYPLAPHFLPCCKHANLHAVKNQQSGKQCPAATAQLSASKKTPVEWLSAHARLQVAGVGCRRKQRSVPWGCSQSRLSTSRLGVWPPNRQTAGNDFALVLLPRWRCFFFSPSHPQKWIGVFVCCSSGGQ